MDARVLYNNKFKSASLRQQGGYFKALIKISHKVINNMVKNNLTVKRENSRRSGSKLSVGDNNTSSPNKGIDGAKL